MTIGNAEAMSSVRLAQHIHRFYQQRSDRSRSDDDSSIRSIIESTLRTTDRLERQLVLARIYRWSAAHQRLHAQYRAWLRTLRSLVDGRLNEITRPALQIPTLGLLFDELEAVKAEFDGMEFDFAGGRLSVETEPIVLEDVNFGRFRIELVFADLVDRHALDAVYIEALEPLAAACDEYLFHPHVRDSRLCTGDAGPIIGQNLTEGRLCDAMIVIRNTLNTYNSESPYVAIEDWDGRSCHECGRFVREDESTFCADCEREFCEQCTDQCADCRSLVCCQCIQQSEVSQSNVCQGCVATCASCRRSCLDAELEGGNCPACLEEDEEPNEPAASHARASSPPEVMAIA